jgi:hypothetical protein
VTVELSAISIPLFYYSILAAVEAVLGQQFIVIVVDCTGGFAQ